MPQGFVNDWLNGFGLGLTSGMSIWFLAWKITQQFRALKAGAEVYNG